MSKLRPSWNEYFLLLAKIVSTRSTCNSRPVGAIIVKDNYVLASGYNGAKSGVEHCIDQDDFNNGLPFCYRRSLDIVNSEKQHFCKSTHAEVNAISQAAERGISIEGATLYVTLAPCRPCLSLLSKNNIKAIYYEYAYESGSLEDDIAWKNEVNESSLEICEQLIIPPETYQYCLKDIQLPTSRRRLRATS